MCEFCKFCVLFAPQTGVGRNNQRPGRLVVTKYDKWKNALQAFHEHQLTDYHNDCVKAAENLQKVARGEIPSVDVVLNSQLKQQIVDNRKRILPIIDTVILCGRQGLALRGDGDHGNMQSLEDPLTNDGNFRALLRYRTNGGDEHLVNQLLRSGLNATYISPTIQNEVIHACNDLILADVVEKVNAAHCFSVLADETADISGTEQFALCVRYMDCDVGVVREDFLQFVPVFDVTGKSLATVLNDRLIRFGTDVQYLRGQGYDGAAAMSGRLHGAQSYVRALHPLALYVHCGAHSLNLAISDACAVAPIRNCLGTIGSGNSLKLMPPDALILAQNAPKCVWRPGSARTRWGSLSAPPDPIAAKGGPTSKGRGREGRERGKEGREREGRGGEERGKEGEGKGGGFGRTNKNTAATAL